MKLKTLLFAASFISLILLPIAFAAEFAFDAATVFDEFNAILFTVLFLAIIMTFFNGYVTAKLKLKGAWPKILSGLGLLFIAILIINVYVGIPGEAFGTVAIIYFGIYGIATAANLGKWMGEKEIWKSPEKAEEAELIAESKKLRIEGYPRAAKALLKQEEVNAEIIKTLKALENELIKAREGQEALSVKEIEEKQKEVLEIEAALLELEKIYKKHQLFKRGFKREHVRHMIGELIKAKFAITEETLKELGVKLQEAKHREEEIKTEIKTAKEKKDNDKVKKLENEKEELSKRIHLLKILVKEEFKENEFNERDKYLKRIIEAEGAKEEEVIEKTEERVEAEEKEIEKKETKEAEDVIKE